MMAKPLRPGQLNPLNFSLKTPIATPDKIIDNPMSLYGQSVSNLMNPNLFEGVKQFKAQVLLSVTSEEEDGFLWQTIRSVTSSPWYTPVAAAATAVVSTIIPGTGPAAAAAAAAAPSLTPPQNKYCICRIPEIHQTIADPNLYEDDDPRKVKAILKHPVFEVNMSGLGKDVTQNLNIGRGSIVSVTFFDALMRTGEVTGIILNSDTSNPLNIGGGTRNAFLFGMQAFTSLGVNQALWYRPAENRKINLIVLHITAGRAGPGRAQATIDYFAGRRGGNEVLDGTRQVSIHYAIDQGGTIVQGVEEKDIAYHTGDAKNYTSIGIEMCGNPGIDDGSEYTKNIGGRAGNWPPGAKGISAGKGYLGKYAGMYTKELIEGVAKLCAEICDRHSLEISRKTIIGHEDVMPGSKWGPGESLNKRYPDGDDKYWNWDDFLERVKGYSTSYSASAKARNALAVDPYAESLLDDTDAFSSVDDFESSYPTSLP